jgi:divalent metal cation (Fe/Co/Zn/Cd) transporter
VLARSQGLVADGIHSLSDLLADFVVLFAGHHASKAADADHPYGHQRFETAASLALGALLLGVGMGMLWSAPASSKPRKACKRCASSRSTWPAPPRWPRNCLSVTC